MQPNGDSAPDPERWGRGLLELLDRGVGSASSRELVAGAPALLLLTRAGVAGEIPSAVGDRAHQLLQAVLDRAADESEASMLAEILDWWEIVYTGSARRAVFATRHALPRGVEQALSWYVDYERPAITAIRAHGELPAAISVAESHVTNIEAAAPEIGPALCAPYVEAIAAARRLEPWALESLGTAAEQIERVAGQRTVHHRAVLEGSLEQLSERLHALQKTVADARRCPVVESPPPNGVEPEMADVLLAATIDIWATHDPARLVDRLIAAAHSASTGPAAIRLALLLEGHPSAGWTRRALEGLRAIEAALDAAHEAWERIPSDEPFDADGYAGAARDAARSGGIAEAGEWLTLLNAELAMSRRSAELLDLISRVEERVSALPEADTAVASDLTRRAREEVAAREFAVAEALLKDVADRLRVPSLRPREAATPVESSQGRLKPEQRAKQLFEAGHEEAAEALLRDRIREAPGSPGVFLLLRIFNERGDLGAAEELVAELAGRSADRPSHYARMAQIAMTHGDTAAAIRHGRTAMRLGVSADDELTAELRELIDEEPAERSRVGELARRVGTLGDRSGPSLAGLAATGDRRSILRAAADLVRDGEIEDALALLGMAQEHVAPVEQGLIWTERVRLLLAGDRRAEAQQILDRYRPTIPDASVGRSPLPEAEALEIWIPRPVVLAEDDPLAGMLELQEHGDHRGAAEACMPALRSGSRRLLTMTLSEWLLAGEPLEALRAARAYAEPDELREIPGAACWNIGVALALRGFRDEALTFFEIATRLLSRISEGYRSSLHRFCAANGLVAPAIVRRELSSQGPGARSNPTEELAIAKQRYLDGQLHVARRLLEQQLAVPFAPSTLLLMKIYRESGDLLAARRARERLAEAGINNWRWHYEVASVALAAGDEAAAASDLDTAVALGAPDDWVGNLAPRLQTRTRLEPRTPEPPSARPDTSEITKQSWATWVADQLADDRLAEIVTEAERLADHHPWATLAVVQALESGARLDEAGAIEARLLALVARSGHFEAVRRLAEILVPSDGVLEMLVLAERHLTVGALPALWHRQQWVLRRLGRDAAADDLLDRISPPLPRFDLPADEVVEMPHLEPLHIGGPQRLRSTMTRILEEHPAGSAERLRALRALAEDDYTAIGTVVGALAEGFPLEVLKLFDEVRGRAYISAITAWNLASAYAAVGDLGRTVASLDYALRVGVTTALDAQRASALGEVYELGGLPRPRLDHVVVRHLTPGDRLAAARSAFATDPKHFNQLARALREALPFKAVAAPAAVEEVDAAYKRLSAPTATEQASLVLTLDAAGSRDRAWALAIAAVRKPAPSSLALAVAVRIVVDQPRRLETLLAAIQDDPANYEAQLALAKLHLAICDYGPARVHAEQALRSNPRASEAGELLRKIADGDRPATGPRDVDLDGIGYRLRLRKDPEERVALLRREITWDEPERLRALLAAQPDSEVLAAALDAAGDERRDDPEQAELRAAVILTRGGGSALTEATTCLLECAELQLPFRATRGAVSAAALALATEDRGLIQKAVGQLLRRTDLRGAALVAWAVKHGRLDVVTRQEIGPVSEAIVEKLVVTAGAPLRDQLRSALRLLGRAKTPAGRHALVRLAEIEEADGRHAFAFEARMELISGDGELRGLANWCTSVGYHEGLIRTLRRMQDADVTMTAHEQMQLRAPSEGSLARIAAEVDLLEALDSANHPDQFRAHLAQVVNSLAAASGLDVSVLSRAGTIWQQLIDTAAAGRDDPDHARAVIAQRTLEIDALIGDRLPETIAVFVSRVATVMELECRRLLTRTTRPAIAVEVEVTSAERAVDVDGGRGAVEVVVTMISERELSRTHVSCGAAGRVLRDLAPGDSHTVLLMPGEAVEGLELVIEAEEYDGETSRISLPVEVVGTEWIGIDHLFDAMTPIGDGRWEAFQGRDDLREQLIRYYGGGHQGPRRSRRIKVLHGPREIGKTTLARSLHPAADVVGSRMPEAVTVVLVNAEMWTSEVTFFDWLAQEIHLHAPAVRAPTGLVPRGVDFRRWLRGATDRQLLVVLDEIQELLTRLTDDERRDILGPLRTMVTDDQDPIAFLLLGSVPFDRLKERLGESPIVEELDPMLVGFLGEDSARRAFSSALGPDARVLPSGLQRIWELTGGYPNHIHLLGERIAERLERDRRRVVDGDLVQLVGEELAQRPMDVIKMIVKLDEAPSAQRLAVLETVSRFGEGPQPLARDEILRGMAPEMVAEFAELERIGLMRSDDHGIGRAYTTTEWSNELIYSAVRRYAELVQFQPAEVVAEAEVTEPAGGGTAAALEERGLRALIARGEGGRLEFKSTVKCNLHTGQADEQMGKAVVRAVAALLNASGGELLIGVADDGEVLGLDHDMKLLGRRANRDGYEGVVRALLNQWLGPLAPTNVEIGFVETCDGDVCHVKVGSSPRPVHAKANVSADEEFYVRTGNETRRLTGRNAFDYQRDHWPNLG